jgi:exodeoxyribonuclease V alpha subunit
MQSLTGQHWSALGSIEEKPVERNGFMIIELHIDPTKCTVTLLETGENFIKFIAK